MISFSLAIALFLGSPSFSYAQAVLEMGTNRDKLSGKCDSRGSMSFRQAARCRTGQTNEPAALSSGLPNNGNNSLQGGVIYQVHILGEVSFPGTYRVPPSTRISEAISHAGGISERGSERRIQWRRKEHKTRQIDLFSFKKQGNLNENPFLNDNDVIFVPSRERVVQVVGAIKKPGIYELKREKTLQDIVVLAGGLTPGAGNPTPIKVIRFIDGEKKKIEIPNAKEDRRKFQIQGSDVIVIPHFLTAHKKFDYNVGLLPGDSDLFFPSYEERVFVIGAVRKPGAYLFSPYYNLGQYLTLAGGTAKEAKPIRKWRVIDSQGNSKKGKIDSEINPGDTIVVPEKSFSKEALISILLTSTTTILGSVATVIALTR